MSLWDRLENIDSRIIYSLVFIVLAIPIIQPVGLPLKISPLTQEAYDIIDTMPPGSKVLYQVCIYPGCMGEMGPPVVATIQHLLEKDLKIYFIDLQPSGVGIMNMLPPLFEEIPAMENAVYDEDYLMLGFYAGGEPTYKAIGSDVKSIVKVDMYGTKVEELEMMNDINSVADFDLLINTGECNIGFMMQWSKPYERTTIMVPLMFGLAPDIMPQYEAGVVQGVIAGLRGGAEYEFLIGQPGAGLAGMDSISFSHSMVIILLILGNLGYAVQRFSGGEE
jgi:hypothetical protein